MPISSHTITATPPLAARKFFVRYVRLLLCTLVLVCSASFAADSVFELEREYVYGKNRRPRMGYVKPEVFDPLSDRLYQAGYRDYAPTAIPDELKQVDAMTRVRKMGHILACADAWFWPFSRTAHANEPAGIDIEILQAIAKKQGWAIDIAWANTGMRLGVGVTFGRTIDKGICDVFLGLTVTGDDHHMPAHKMTFTAPYLSTGFVLVTQGPAKSVRDLEDAKSQGVKLGVPAFSPMSEYAEANLIPHANFFQNYQVIDALLRHEVDAAMLWSGAIAQARLEHPEAEFELVKGYVPLQEMRWNSAWGVKEGEEAFKAFIDAAFADMLKSGEIKRIVERYGVPFYPPVTQ